jgi:ABC-type bacteriocin/lantibiotic exporter with double-glycine peptidase domain
LKKHPLSFIFSITALLLVSSCMTAQQIPQTHDMHVISDVPFFPQEDYQCGPASLASILTFWNIHTEPDEIGREIFSKSARGTLTIDMMLYAQKKGLHVHQFKGSIDALRNYVDSGYPLIVLVDYGISLFQMNHFMVVTGYSNTGVIVHSGQFQNKLLLEKDFLASWKKTDYWTLLIKKP